MIWPRDLNMWKTKNAYRILVRNIGNRALERPKIKWGVAPLGSTSRNTRSKKMPTNSSRNFS